MSREFLGISKPSEALRAMAAGLRAADERPDCRINTDCWGYRDDNDVCLGCAATFALMHLNDGELPSFGQDAGETSREWAEICDAHHREIQSFELSIDSMRFGDGRRLAIFFDVEMPKPTEEIHLNTETWQADLPKIERYAEQLEAAGL